MATLSQEELSSLLGDLELNEDTLKSLQGLVESRLNTLVESTQTTLSEKHTAELAALNEAHAAEIAALKVRANEYGLMINESITGQVHAYTDRVVGEFIAEHKEKFETLEESARIKGAFALIKDAFETNGFTINENKALTEATERLEESKALANSLLEESNSLKEKLKITQQALIFEEITGPLADTQKEKVRTLSESVLFEDTEQYTKGIQLIVAQVATATPAPPTPLNEQIEKPVNARMAKYLNEINKS